MTYRDEKESLRAEVSHLEAELADARSTIARLRGEAGTPSETGGDARVGESGLLGAPISYERSHELPYEISDEGFEAIAKLLRERLSLQVAQVGRTLTGYAAPAGRAAAPEPPVFTLTREHGTTRIWLRGQWAPLAGGVVASGFLAAVFGGLPVVGVLADVSTRFPMASPLHALWVVPALAGSAAWVARTVLQKRARKHLEGHRGTFESVLATAEAHRVANVPVRARVETAPAEADVELDAAIAPVPYETSGDP